MYRIFLTESEEHGQLTVTLEERLQEGWTYLKSWTGDDRDILIEKAKLFSMEEHTGERVSNIGEQAVRDLVLFSRSYHLTTILH